MEFGTAESGPNELDRSIHLSNKVNHFEPKDCTVKGVGGTSKTWGGRCVTFDEVDFMPREAVRGNCTWDPSVFHDVKRFYEVAATYMDCEPARFSLHDIPGAEGERIAEGFDEGDVLDSGLERWSLPTRYGDKFGDHLRQSPNIHVVVECRADLLRSTNGEVGALVVCDRRTQKSGEVTGKNYVIAAGGQETTRLLLKSVDVFSQLESVPSSLGRYYHGHLVGQIATVKFSGNPRKTEHSFRRDGQAYVRRRFQLAPEVLLREGLLNCAIWLDNPPYHDPVHRSGTMSMIYLMLVSPILGDWLAPASMRETVTKGEKRYKIGQHVWNVVRGAPRSLLEPSAIFIRRYLLHRKLPGVFLYNSRNEYALNFQAEQTPNQDSRMSLSEDGESLLIDFRYSLEDANSVIRTHRILDEWLRKTGSGELCFWYDDDQLAEALLARSRDGVHQGGTTRMGRSPNESVLDFNLKVWGANNLYCCSSSAFPTSGHANPTFLLLAFAARLADLLCTHAIR